MQRLQAFKFELMPDGEQQRDMRRFAGSCRFVYNKALAMQKENHESGNKFIGYVPMAANLPIWKREAGTEWLKDTPSQALQHALKNLEKAYKNFFAKRADFPRFKRKGSGDSFRYPERLIGCEIIVVNQESMSPQQEMVEDLMAIVHTFSSRLYGMRKYKTEIKADFPEYKLGNIKEVLS